MITLTLTLLSNALKVWRPETISISALTIAKL